MGNSGSNDQYSNPASLSGENDSRPPSSPCSSKLKGGSPAFRPKFARSDTTVAEAGSLCGSPKIGHPGTPNTSANTSFPLSESALPTTFDTSSDDFAADQLSHFFPLPPAEPNFNSPSHASLHQAPMSSLEDEIMRKASLQETLDTLWAPPKHVPVRISAPMPLIASKQLQMQDEPLIDLSCEEVSMPIMPSFVASSTSTIPALSSSADTSVEGLIDGCSPPPSGHYSGHDSGPNIKADSKDAIGGVQIRRSETLPELLASHPELDFGPLESSPKKGYENNARYNTSIEMSEHASLVLDNGDFIQLPPTTYADATDIASKFPELAAKVLNEPLASPVRAARDVELAEPEAEATHHSIVVERMALSPPHTPDRPNWALAPDDPGPSPVRTYNDSGPRRARGGPPSRRQSSTYAQGQEELEEMGQFGRRSSQSERFSRQGHGSERSHDMPPHLAAEAARDGAMSTSFQSHSPSRSSAPPLDAWGPATGGSAPVENSSLAPAADEWIQIHDGWAVRGAEKHPEAHRQPDGGALDEWTPVHDGWAVRHDGAAADLPTEAHRRPDGGAVNEWTTRHDPWTENHDRQTLEPQNKYETPSRIRGSSPFRDRMNDSANQSDRSGSFSADVLYVRPPVQSSIASLAASHAAEMRRRDAGQHIPVEFDYFAHSNAIDWTSSAPTKPGQNAFSPSQRVSSPSRDSGDASHVQHSATSSHDRRASENHLNNSGHDDNFQVNLPPSASTFVVGSLKSDWQYRDGESHRRTSPASSWGPPGSDRVQEHRDGGRGKAGDSHEFTIGNDGYDRGQESNNRFCGGNAYESRGKRLPTQNEEYRKFRESMGYGSGPRYSDAQRSSYGARNLLLPAADSWNY